MPMWCYVVTDVDFASQTAKVVDIFDRRKVEPHVFVDRWNAHSILPMCVSQFAWANKCEDGWRFYA